MARRQIGCDWIEAIRPVNTLQQDYVILLDEEAKLNGNLNINCLASFVYDSASRQEPVVGNAVIVKAEGESLVMLSIMEAARIVHTLKEHRAEAIDYIRHSFNIVTEQA